MDREPILAARTLPKGADGYNVSRTFRVLGGLHYMKGNSAPYFSLTCWAFREGLPNQCQSGGADHETILRYYPQFADLAALHLSDLSGAPMHAEANGWYKLAGALGGMGEKYHVGNSDRNFPLPDDRRDLAKPWQTTEYRKPTKAEALQIFADHCRIPIDEARDVAAAVMFADNPREAWREYVETLRPRWAEQAAACIAAHDLKLFGDVAAWEERKGAAEAVAALARAAGGEG